MANSTKISKVDDLDLGLDEVDSSVDKAQTALNEAAAASAVAAAAEAQGALAKSRADRTYITEKKNFMLKKCKTDAVKKFKGEKIYAQYFGDKYTYLFNGIPVSVKFDGSTQEFPEFIYNDIMEKISLVAEENVPKSVDTKL